MDNSVRTEDLRDQLGDRRGSKHTIAILHGLYIGFLAPLFMGMLLSIPVLILLIAYVWIPFQPIRVVLGFLIGLILLVACIALPVMGIALGLYGYREQRRPSVSNGGSHCNRCRYDLISDTSGNCPECGARWKTIKSGE